MIRFFDEKDRFDVISIWQEAFGDDKEEIIIFLEFLKKDIIVLEREGKIISMLALLPVRIGAETGRYIYAVATDKAYRRRGCAGRLIEYAKHFIVENNEKFLVLLPQEKKLCNFYKRFGFYELYCAKNINAKINLNEPTNVKAEIISAKDYFLFRKSYFSNERFVNWDIKTLEFMKKAYNGNFFVIENENAAFCYSLKDRIVVPELLAIGNASECIKALAILYGTSNAQCICPSKEGEEFAMIYPGEYSDTYFGLGMK